MVLLIVAAAGFGIYQGLRASKMKQQVATLQSQDQQETIELSQRVESLERELAAATSAPAPASQAPAPQTASRENLRLRGEVGRLTREKEDLATTNAISKITANPKARKMMRDQQKTVMTMIYRELAQRANLTSEQTEELNDALADYIMDNVDRVTTVLRDKPSPEEVNRIFSSEDAVLHEKVRELLGDEGLEEFKSYSGSLLSTITAEQFKGMMSGEGSEKQAKAKQLSEAIQEESQRTLAELGLPADYQPIPTLNLRNIASEQEGERSLKVLDEIYQRVAARAGAFLTPDEVKKFEEFRTTGVQNNRAALMMNRTLMAPIAR